MTRQEAVAITAHDDLLAAVVEMRGVLARIASGIGVAPGTRGMREIEGAIETADRALAMAGWTYDGETGRIRHVA